MNSILLHCIPVEVGVETGRIKPKLTSIRMDKCVFLLFDELVFKVEEVVLTVSEVKVLYKVIAVYVSLSLPLLHSSCICPFIHLPGSNTAGTSTLHLTQKNQISILQQQKCLSTKQLVTCPTSATEKDNTTSIF